MLKTLVLFSLAISCESFVANTPGRAAVKEKARCVGEGNCAGIFPRLGKVGTLSMSENSASKFDRRNMIAGMLILTVPIKKTLAVPYPPPTSSPIVIEGQMRLEKGSEKILAAVGGRANATVVLRIVGRGIISTTHLEIDVADFPPPGQPKPGESGGVPFYVTEADLNAKTEKGVTVTRTLWADDDIFVRIDVNSDRDGKVLSQFSTSYHPTRLSFALCFPSLPATLGFPSSYTPRVTLLQKVSSSGQ
jgi:hypothetical protein